MRALRSNPAGVDLGPLRPTMPARLQTRDKLIHLAPDLVVADLVRLRRQHRDSPDGDELLLIGRRHQPDNNSWMHNSDPADPGQATPPAADAPRRPGRPRATDGTSVRVASRVGHGDDRGARPPTT